MRRLSASDLIAAGLDCIAVRHILFADERSHHGKRIVRHCEPHRFNSLSEALEMLKTFELRFVFEYGTGDEPSARPTDPLEEVSLLGAFGQVALPKEFPKLVETNEEKCLITGEVNVTNGSRQVTGIGTSFKSQLHRGDLVGFSCQDNAMYTVDGLQTDTLLLLKETYDGNTNMEVEIDRWEALGVPEGFTDENPF